MSAPAVSVVIPVFNTGAYLEDAVRTILDQSLREIEVICIDDGSTDGSAAVLDRLAAADERIRVIHQGNAGLGASRNRGAALATGHWLYFFDSDDRLDADALAQLVATGSAMAAQIVYFDATAFTDDPELADEATRLSAYYDRSAHAAEVLSGAELYRRFVADRLWRPSACLQFFDRAWYVAEHLVFPEGVLHEDQLFSVEAALRAERVSYLARPLFRRRLRAQSITMAPKSYAHVEGLLQAARGLGRVAARTEDAATRHALAQTIASAHRQAVDALARMAPGSAAEADGPHPSADLAGILPLYEEFIAERARARHAERQFRAISRSRGYRIAMTPTRIIRRILGRGASSTSPAAEEEHRP